MTKVRKKARSMRARQPTGSWEEFAVYGTEPDTSAGHVVLRRVYERARGGHLPSIKIILRMIKVHAAAQQLRAEHEGRQAERLAPVSSRACKEERRADPALLLLGIGLVSNYDMARLGTPDDPWFESELKGLRPTYLARWVLDWATTRDDGMELSELALENVRLGCRDEDDPDVSLWRDSKDQLLAQIVALRGPEGNRFQKGETGNSRGRPRRTAFGYPDDDPMGKFFTEEINVKVHGEEEKLSRLHALMLNLVIDAAKGDEKIGALLAPNLVQAFQRQWEERFEPEPIYETRI